MRCKTCDYPLENLSEHYCPECGTGFDPNDLSSFESTISRNRRTLRSLVIALLGISVVVLLLSCLSIVFVNAFMRYL